MRHRPRKTARVCVRTEAVPGPARGRGITSGDGLIRLPRRTDEALRKCKSASTEPALDTRFTGPGIADETVFCLKQENRHAMNRVPAIIAAALIVAAAGQLTSKAQASEIVDPTNAPPVLSTENSSAGGLRLEGGAGYNNGARGMTVSVPGIGSVSTNLLGGDGLAAEAALWFELPLGGPASYEPWRPISLLWRLGVGHDVKQRRSDTRADFGDGQPQPDYACRDVQCGVASKHRGRSSLSRCWCWCRVHHAIRFGSRVLRKQFTGCSGRPGVLWLRLRLHTQRLCWRDRAVFYQRGTYHAPGIGVSNNIEITNRPLSLMAHLGFRF